MKSLFLTLLAMVACVSLAQAQSSFTGSAGLNLQSSGAPAQANWVATAHDFGSISQGTPVSHTFEVENTGQQPLKIEHVKPSCGCTVADYTKEPIAPGEKGFVTATYNAKGLGMFTKSLTVRTNEEETPIMMLRIKGEVKP